jgi:hypothetical protein
VQHTCQPSGSIQPNTTSDGNAAHAKRAPSKRPSRAGRGQRKAAAALEMALPASQDPSDGGQEVEAQQVMLMRMINTMMTDEDEDDGSMAQLQLAVSKLIKTKVRSCRIRCAPE